MEGVNPSSWDLRYNVLPVMIGGVNSSTQTEHFKASNNYLCSFIRNESSSTLGHTGVVSVTTASTLIASSSNTNRISIYVQNDGNVPLIISLGSSASITNRNYVLNQATGTRTGDGGSFNETNWIGSIYGIVETGTAEVTVTEVLSEL